MGPMRGVGATALIMFVAGILGVLTAFELRDSMQHHAEATLEREYLATIDLELGATQQSLREAIASSSA